MKNVNEELKMKVNKKYLETLDMLDYGERKNITIENLKDVKYIENSNGNRYEVLATFEDNALLYTEDNKYHPYTVAKGIYPSLRSWISGSYHAEGKSAINEYNELVSKK